MYPATFIYWWVGSLWSDNPIVNLKGNKQVRSLIIAYCSIFQINLQKFRFKLLTVVDIEASHIKHLFISDIWQINSYFPTLTFDSHSISPAQIRFSEAIRKAAL